MLNLVLTHTIGLLGFALAVLATLHMLAQRRSPQSTIAWLVVMFVFPWVGVPLYLALGGRKMRELMATKVDLELNITSSQNKPKPLNTTATTLCSLGIPAPSTTNRLQLHDDGRDAYQTLDALLASSNQRIDFATFILADDNAGRAIINRLVERACLGVDVRLIVDAVGTFSLPRSSLTSLEKAGGKVAYFMPVLHRPFRGRTNLRNHRKMVIVDDRHVWTGGRNSADDYLSVTDREPPWIDLSCSITGPASAIFCNVFDSDWRFASPYSDTGTRSIRTPFNDYAQSPLSEVESESTSLQIVPSGPDAPNDPFFAALVSGIYAAHSRVWLVTPYFVPPDSLTDALILASRKGVDVRLIVPSSSNHRLADWAREPHFTAVAEAGGAVRLHPRMVHAKTIVLDNEVAWLGSANLDERSLLLNFEIMMAIYPSNAFDSVVSWIARLDADCSNWSATSGRFKSTIESLAKTVAPLL